LDLPSFLWLWKIAAWAMGFTVVAYLLQAGTGISLAILRQSRPDWLRPFHFIIGGVMALLVLLLLAIGIVGTLGHYGNLGHSTHLPAGLAVVELVFLSAWSAVQISPDRPWAKPLHLGTNLVLCVALAIVSWTGWKVVQKYL
jgi:tryptophan-rich sensory protein